MFPGSSVSWVYEKPGQNPGFTLESENLGAGKALGNTLVQAPLETGETGCIVQEDRRCEEGERVRVRGSRTVPSNTAVLASSAS